MQLARSKNKVPTLHFLLCFSNMDNNTQAGFCCPTTQFPKILSTTKKIVFDWLELSYSKTSRPEMYSALFEIHMSFFDRVVLIFLLPLKVLAVRA